MNGWLILRFTNAFKFADLQISESTHQHINTSVHQLNSPQSRPQKYMHRSLCPNANWG